MGAAMTARERLRELAMWGDDRTADELLDDYAVEVARAERIATYRAAADEIEAEADQLNIPGSPANHDAIRGMTHAAELLRARADQMGQQ